MVARIEAFNVTIPAGTPQATPAHIATTFPDGVVVGLEIRVPSGPSGLMGFAFAHSQQQIIPRTSGAWIILEDDFVSWPLADYPTGGAWAVWGYNTDQYDHTIYVHYLINETTSVTLPSVTIQPIG